MVKTIKKIIEPVNASFFMVAEKIIKTKPTKKVAKQNGRKGQAKCQKS